MPSCVAQDRTAVDLRCPVALHSDCEAGKLLARLQLDGERPAFVQPNNLIEMPCDSCKRTLRQRGEHVRRVLHRYDFGGALVETLVVRD